VRDEWVQELAGASNFVNATGNQEGREVLLPVVVPAFDFAPAWGAARAARTLKERRRRSSLAAARAERYFCGSGLRKVQIFFVFFLLLV